MRGFFLFSSISALIAFGLTLSAVQGQRLKEVSELAPSTVSTSQQFHVFSEDGATRGTIAGFAEGIKDEFLETLGRKDQWRYPIVIQVHGDLRDLGVELPIVPRLDVLDRTYRLELSVKLGTTFDQADLRNSLYHLLLLEMVLPELNREPDAELVPRWLRVGLPAAVRYKQMGRPSSVFSSLFQSGQVLLAEDVLSSVEEENDTASESIYEASASGFVLMLLQQSNGPEKMSQVIMTLGRGDQSMQDRLARYFPALRGKADRLEKWWALQVATLAKPQALEHMSADATEKALEEALKVSFLEFADSEVATEPTKKKKKRGVLRIFKFFGREEDPKESEEEVVLDPLMEAAVEEAEKTVEVTVGIEEFDRFIRRKDRQKVLAPCQRNLIELSFRAFPLHRPLVEDYRRIVEKLERGELDGVEEKLVMLAHERAQLKEMLTHIWDYLNYYEVTELKKRSGAFDTYLQRARELRDLKPNREDPLSRYLDSMEQFVK